MDSPRGRIRQVVEVDQGRLEIDKSFVTHIDRCLDCRACETACPSGVQYGKIVERAKAQIEQNYRRPIAERVARKVFYGFVLKDAARLRGLAGVLRILQRSGLQSLARRLGMLRVLGLEELEALSPKMDRKFFGREIGQVFPAAGERRGRVAFHAGCIQQVAFADLNRATIRLLQKNGIEVHVPKQQVCCGALHAHAGLREDARVLARKNIDAMLSSDFDAIVTNAAGCGSALKEYDDLLEHDLKYRDQAQVFKAKTKDISEYLLEIGLLAPKRKLEQRVAYQDACHLLHGQKIKVQPRELLRAVGAEIVELEHADQCCGSAGTYNITENKLSMQILDRKMEDLNAVSSEMVVTGNVGCQLQIRYGMSRSGRTVPVLHIVEALESCY
jgi:glycolate oxidase iron-sulfur subunit